MKEKLENQTKQKDEEKQKLKNEMAQQKEKEVEVYFKRRIIYLKFFNDIFAVMFIGIWFYIYI